MRVRLAFLGLDAPRSAGAQGSGDEEAYYLALHEYVCSVPDGHISLTAEETATPMAIAEELVGGVFGIAVAELDDWRVVAAAVVPDGPAAAPPGEPFRVDCRRGDHASDFS